MTKEIRSGSGLRGLYWVVPGGLYGENEIEPGQWSSPFSALLDQVCSLVFALDELLHDIGTKGFFLHEPIWSGVSCEESRQGHATW